MNRNESIKQVMELETKVNHLILEHRTEKWLSLDLTLIQLKSMVFIHSKRIVSFRDLAEALEITPSVVTGIVDRLIASGMIKRIDNPKDRRVHWLALSDRGNALLDEIRQENIKELREILHTMNDEDLAALVKGITALINATHSYLESHQEHANTIKNKEPHLDI